MKMNLTLPIDASASAHCEGYVLRSEVCVRPPDTPSRFSRGYSADERSYCKATVTYRADLASPFDPEEFFVAAIGFFIESGWQTTGPVLCPECRRRAGH